MTGASARNWSSYGRDVRLAPKLGDDARLLLCDPQTSGGLLVACAPDRVDDVLHVFAQEGFERAAVIGEMTSEAGLVTVS